MSPITKKLLESRNSGVLNLSGAIKREEMLASGTNENGSNSSSGGSGKSSSSRQYGRVNRIVLDKTSDEYKKRRERNNMAVKKSRNKSKLRTQQTMQRVTELKEENERLETKVKILSKELSFLKDLFLAHAGSSHTSQTLESSNGYNGSHDSAAAAPISSNIITSTLTSNGSLNQESLSTPREKN